MVTPGQILSLSIEKPAVGGRMIARFDGQVVLVGGAIPGEQVRARVERVGRGVAYADVLSVEEPSPDRRTLDADPLCGGCLFSHVAYPRQLVLKGLVIEDAFARIARTSLPAPVSVRGSAEEGYRMRARLHVRDGQAGFFREGTHDLCDVRGTRQLLTGTCDAIERMMAGLRSLGMAGGGEVDISENVSASQRVVHLDAAGPVDIRALGGVGATDGLTGFVVSSGRRGTGPTTVAGDAYVTDVLNVADHPVTLRRHVMGFFQGNRYLLHALVEHVVGAVDPGDAVIDLYAGAGLFSVAAAIAKGARVTSVEGDRIGAADLKANAARLSGGSVEAVHLPVEEFVRRRQAAPAVLIVDPPRTGMSKEAMQGALGVEAPKVVYVSCDVATLARDARRWLDAGYHLTSVEGFDLFPNTPHVETIATFVRG